VATWGRGLGYFNETSGQFSFSLFERDHHVGTDNIVFNIQEAVKSKDRSLFFVSTNKGLCLPDMHNPESIRFKYFYSHHPDDPKSIGSIPSQTLIDNQGIIWVGTDKDVSYILPSTQVFRQANSTNSPSGLINSITEEKLSNSHYQYWLSCWYTGGLMLCDENFLPKKKVQLPVGYGQTANSRQINQVVIDPETKDVWIATMDGLYKWSRAKNIIKAYYPNKSNPLSLPSEHVMTLLLDHQNRLWIGTYHMGFTLMNTANDAFIKLPDSIQNAAKGRRVFCMYEDSKQRIWLGCAGALFRLDEKTGKWQIYEHQKNNNKSKASGDVNGIAEDKNGNIWIGNDEGLNRYNEKTSDFDLFTTADGLSNDHIYNIVCDKAGILWAGTTSGLNSIDPATNIIKSFYEKDGLSLNDQSNAIMIKSDNEIVAAGAKGTVTIFDPAKLYRNSSQPPVYITSLKLFNKQDNRQSYFPLPKEVNLSYNENYFSIDFIALNLMNADDNKYAYQLTGLDKNWIQSGSEHSVTYSNLSAGQYTFKVKAANNDGVWNNQGSSLIITISPPFWKTWWFITLCVIVIIIIGYSLYNYRLEQLLQVERLRTKISTDLHDDIGSTLSSISILSELVLHKKDKDQADEMLNEIKDNAISLMEKMDDIVWSINPKNDSLEDLLSRITRFASQLFEAKNIEHNITIQPDIKDLKLSMESRQHLYLMIKESINNILKHANCTKASIAATCKDHLLHVVINDNGKGFKTDKNHSGNGLINLKERATKMSADVQIDSIPRKGTTVTISIKIK
jgi:ligand-binding sensor domain-containing protein/two-component sensor histidine kinase